MPKYLVKFVDSKYLPDFADLEEYVIQLGSFKYYREIEDKKRNDVSEGQKGLHLVIKKPCSKLDEVIKTNGYGHYSPEDIDAEGNFKMTYNLIVHEHLADYNAWIFSCSFLEDLNDIPKLQKKFECDSYYFISNVDGFTNVVQRSLAEDLKIKPNMISGEPRVKHPSTEGVYIDGWKKRINYVNKSKFMHFTCDTLEEFLKHNSRVVDQKFWFQKPELFLKEKEFRFIYFPAGNRGTNKRFTINEDRCLLTVDLTDCISNEPVDLG